jgi:hypothetical protein
MTTMLVRQRIDSINNKAGTISGMLMPASRKQLLK